MISFGPLVRALREAVLEALPQALPRGRFRFRKNKNPALMPESGVPVGVRQLRGMWGAPDAYLAR